MVRLLVLLLYPLHHVCVSPDGWVQRRHASASARGRTSARELHNAPAVRGWALYASPYAATQSWVPSKAMNQGSWLLYMPHFWDPLADATFSISSANWSLSRIDM